MASPPSVSPWVDALRFVKETFDRSTACLEEADAGFAPVPGLFTTAQQVAHVAHAVTWFLDGACNPKGFDLDFAAQEARARRVTRLADARRAWEDAMARVIEWFARAPSAELTGPIAPGPIMGGAPRHTIVEGIADHTAHHRGALTVYARLCGRTPAMPYG